MGVSINYVDRILRIFWPIPLRWQVNHSWLIDYAITYLDNIPPRASPKCYKCPKKHIGPTIWFHSIKLKLFKLIFINRFNDLFLLFSEMTVLRNQNKAREEPESWILKSFNLIEWNQIVGPVCFLTFGRRSEHRFLMLSIFLPQNLTCVCSSF